MNSRPCIAVLGGTGKEGSGLALRWARVGFPIVIGSRDPERARHTAERLRGTVPGAELIGLSNAEAAAQGEVVVVAVPYEGHASILQSLRDILAHKLIIDVVVPLDPSNPRRYAPPPDGSATAEAQRILGPETPVVGAFHNISHLHLHNLDEIPDCDVLVVGDHREAKARVIALAEAIGFTAYDAGPLANASIVEGLTAVLIGLNIRYKGHGAGIRITGISKPAFPTHKTKDL
ncbi:NADPH-dependent F420 reductase [Thermoflexus sp.]|uniref:NADPH-dependent F420 reductase n=1 Tax=Thermoflexus sp. TaxID=1969742 RepID=UPI0025F4CE8D|nr:NADPH-dependent F420 reductase [Thermoflexus sp.]MDW8180708.1 NADPH-dependent F420 reductase [Anaerolineae bacterium]MCS6964503.1 NADPH-dependent F420 reductase [Thermoflexus sp.]MCS7351254.1 NADPH-dependent F420 reductase [Thermoflexus sp.]MCX7690267.1 NADPH-dependent F420 reductase [Thermoflexus sp.]MDW8186178.1 NADPH-dependent F420 reductase [Anaerolineae bacterium]